MSHLSMINHDQSLLASNRHLIWITKIAYGFMIHCFFLAAKGTDTHVVHH